MLEMDLFGSLNDWISLQCMIEEKEQAISSLKLETRQDLLQMQSKFTEKEADLSRTVKQRDDQIRTLNKQIGGEVLSRSLQNPPKFF